jgi:1-acyl-sn-glycerol-3-phosphate acyltransferase
VLAVLLGGVALVVGLVCAPRGLMNLFSRLWSRVILLLSGVRLRIVGAERSAAVRPAFFMGNHQSDLDIPIIICALKGRVRFMAKDSLFRIPLFGWVIRRYGFVPVDRANVRRSLDALKGMLAGLKTRPISMTAFPEGTRSRDGRLLPFRRGTLKIAQQSGLPVVPFAIDGSIDVHHPDVRWVVRPGTVTLTLGEPIAADRAFAMDQDELQEEVVRVIAAALGQPAVNGDGRPLVRNSTSLGPAV